MSWYYDDVNSELRKNPKVYDKDNAHRRLLVAPGFTTPRMGSWSDETKLSGGIAGTGVLSVFDKDSGDSLVFSALDNPMTVSSFSPRKGTLHYGVFGNCTSIPAGFTMSVIASVGKGVNDAFQHWGSSVRKRHGKQSLQVSRSMDVIRLPSRLT